MKKSAKKWVLSGIGSVAVGTVFVKGLRYTVRNLADIAMNRELTAKAQKAMQATPRSVKDPGMEDRRLEAANKLRSSNCQTVKIDTFDGTLLTGHLHLVAHPKRTVITVHGWRSSWESEFGLIADFLYVNDCNVLFIEQRAHGESDGDYIGFGLLERYDLLEWINLVNRQSFGNLPVYLFGLSMGAATVLMTAGEVMPDNVHGIIADSGYTSPRDEWKYVAEHNLHYHYKWMEKYVDKLSKERLGYLSDEYSCPQAMQKCKTPVLFIHGADDTFVPVEMTYTNYKACTAPKRLLIVPGAEHCQSYLVEQEHYEGELLQFWYDFDQ